MVFRNTELGRVVVCPIHNGGEVASLVWCCTCVSVHFMTLEDCSLTLMHLDRTEYWFEGFPDTHGLGVYPQVTTGQGSHRASMWQVHVQCRGSHQDCCVVTNLFQSELAGFSYTVTARALGNVRHVGQGLSDVTATGF